MTNSIGAGCFDDTTAGAAIEIKALILPKFEIGEMSGGFPGEAQYYYEAYCAGGAEYDIRGGIGGHKLYVKDGIALYVTGSGKVNSALSLYALLFDRRFDFSRAYILSTGCAGSAYGSTVMGDVFVVTAAVDFDMGHHADIRDLPDGAETTWFHDPGFDDCARKFLNPRLTSRVYELVKNVRIDTTDKTRAYMSAAFEGADWAVREPRVQKGTIVTGDNYWKGEHGHENAILMAETYGCPDPYALTDMEDAALALALDRLGMLDRFIIIRGSVNMDVFMNGATAESLWAAGAVDSLASEESAEAADIFATAMENIFKVGRVVIDAIIGGTF